MGKQSKMPAIGEGIFSIVYLVFGFVSACILLANSHGNQLIFLFGILTLVLAGGDSFHLVPRIINAFSNNFKDYEFWAGIGLFVSSITMTAFYIFMYGAWQILSNNISVGIIEIIFMICAAMRIVLCLFPQNNWLKKEGNPTWGIIRNVPFVIVGVIMIIRFASIGMWNMAIAILISFACYIPVVLFAKKNPKIGMFMIPKTMAYMWMIGIGLSFI